MNGPATTDDGSKNPRLPGMPDATALEKICDEAVELFDEMEDARADMEALLSDIDIELRGHKMISARFCAVDGRWFTFEIIERPDKVRMKKENPKQKKRSAKV